MPNITVQMYKGRDPAKKKALAVALTNAMVESLGCPIAAVQVIIQDVEKHDWAHAGVMASDPKPGAGA
ncbi:tautomerase family protein [Pseudoxanthobacter sp. M-2]|uniref:tautomerase family protein n=1 Tax=Pseudoxanthobacter sp. M-2 TaxID=3078754 RepID=UPI0038FC7909